MSQTCPSSHLRQNGLISEKLPFLAGLLDVLPDVVNPVVGKAAHGARVGFERGVLQEVTCDGILLKDLLAYVASNLTAVPNIQQVWSPTQFFT